MRDENASRKSHSNGQTKQVDAKIKSEAQQSCMLFVFVANAKSQHARKCCSWLAIGDSIGTKQIRARTHCGPCNAPAISFKVGFRWRGGGAAF